MTTRERVYRLERALLARQNSRSDSLEVHVRENIGPEKPTPHTRNYRKVEGEELVAAWHRGIGEVLSLAFSKDDDHKGQE